MAMDYAPPRYVRLVQTLQERITSGQYPVGELLPSEHQLLREFGVSRATVIRALQILRNDGWVESQQGKGTFVRGRPVVADRPRRGADLVEQAEGGSVQIVRAGVASAPESVAALLGVPAGAEAVLRRRLTSEGGDPVELVSSWFPVEVAAGTELGSPGLLAEGVREHLRTRKGIRLREVTERITARLPTAEEAKLLGITRRSPVLGILLVAHDSAGAAVQVADVVLPGDRHELEDSYALS